MNDLKKYILHVLSDGKNKILALAKFNHKVIHIDILFSDSNTLGSMLLYFQSGALFNKWIREYAHNKGYRLNEYGIYDGDKLHTFSTDKSIFKFLDIPYVSVSNRM